MIFDLDMIKAVYAKYPERIAAARKLLNHPLTLSEKILYSGMVSPMKNLFVEEAMLISLQIE
jgi:hypothetical protein